MWHTQVSLDNATAKLLTKGTADGEDALLREAGMLKTQIDGLVREMNDVKVESTDPIAAHCSSQKCVERKKRTDCDTQTHAHIHIRTNTTHASYIIHHTLKHTHTRTNCVSQTSRQ